MILPILASHEGIVDVSQCTTAVGELFSLMTVYSLPYNWLLISIAPTNVDLEAA